MPRHEVKMDKTIEVNTDAGPVVVHKLALNDYAELLKALKKLPQQFGKFIQGNSEEDLRSNEKLFEVLPDIIATALPEYCNVMAIATDKDADFFGRLDLADNIDVLAAALELNDYNRIVASLKKLAALQRPQKAQPAAGPKS